MLKVVEATIDEKGTVKLLEPIELQKPARAFVVIFSEELNVPDTTLLNGVSLWNRPEEVAAWAYLQPDPSSESDAG